MKRQNGLQGYYNNTSLSPCGEAGILLPSCQNLPDALPYGGRSLLEGNTMYTAGPEVDCPVHINGPGALGINEQKKNTVQFPLTST